MNSWEEISRIAFYSYASRSNERLIVRPDPSIQKQEQLLATRSANMLDIWFRITGALVM
jgi:hypothetical protein